MCSLLPVGEVHQRPALQVWSSQIQAQSSAGQEGGAVETVMMAALPQRDELSQPVFALPISLETQNSVALTS